MVCRPYSVVEVGTFAKKGLRGWLLLSFVWCFLVQVLNDGIIFWELGESETQCTMSSSVFFTASKASPTHRWDYVHIYVYNIRDVHYVA